MSDADSLDLSLSEAMAFALDRVVQKMQIEIEIETTEEIKLITWHWQLLEYGEIGWSGDNAKTLLRFSDSIFTNVVRLDNSCHNPFKLTGHVIIKFGRWQFQRSTFMTSAVLIGIRVAVSSVYVRPCVIIGNCLVGVKSRHVRTIYIVDSANMTRKRTIDDILRLSCQLLTTSTATNVCKGKDLAKGKVTLHILIKPVISDGL